MAAPRIKAGFTREKHGIDIRSGRGAGPHDNGGRKIKRSHTDEAGT